MKYFFILISVFFFHHPLMSQTITTKYCDCKVLGEEYLQCKNDNSINAVASYKKEMLEIEVFNNSKDTIFLFSSYFDVDISTSKYIYRYNKKNKNINISFLPLIPYLYTRYNDKIILPNRMLEDYQTVYDFYKIPPFHKYTFDIRILDLENKNEFIKEIDIRNLNKFQKIKKFKNVILKDFTKIKYYIDIAYYTDITIICDNNSFYLDELKFNKQAKDYEILKIFLDINN